MSRMEDLDDPDLPLTDIMVQWPETIPVFLRHKMLCVGCMIGPFHTVLDACAEHGVEETGFRRALADAVIKAQDRSR